MTDAETAIKNFSKRELGDVKVLMIEDDTFISELVLTKLSKKGCIPYSTADGREAMKLAEHYQPDIIILDLMLPGSSGEEILQSLKGHPALKDIPVIVFSNKSNPEDIEKVKALGAAEFFTKATTDLNVLADMVKKVSKPTAA